MVVLCNTIAIFLSIYSITAEDSDRYWQRYHLAPPKGWMNDPNGFSVFQGIYHLFYQYNPYSSMEPGTANWGHASSSDLLHWTHLPIAMEPDQSYDISGVFSGSALIENDTMYLYYTGHVKHTGETPAYSESQELATSTDGVTFTKYENNPILITPEHQPDIRDPKVWKHEGKYYMVLGNSYDNSTLGQILLYSSTDKINWEQVSILGKSTGKLGYMWECPDFFKLGKYYVLLFSPQGVKADGDNFQNLYQTGYFIGTFDYITNVFTNVTDFVELDHGHDFYATQTLLDEQGRRLVVAWMDMWEQVYPERADNRTGSMTLPRELILSDDLKLLQKPIEEVQTIRCDTIRSGAASGGTTLTLDDKAGEVIIKASASADLELYIEGDNATAKILYESDNGRISLNRGGDDGLRRTAWKPTDEVILDIFIDASSVEVFCGCGEAVFSSRLFINGDINVRLGDNSTVDDMTVYNLKRTVVLN